MVGESPIERAPTGISGFDQIALGGLPAGRATLLAGTTGSGKTLFGVEFLARGIELFDEPGVFVTFEETPEAVRRNSSSLGMPIEQWESEGRWTFVDGSAHVAEDAPIIGTYDLGGLMARLEHAIRGTGARRMVLDSLGAIFTRFSEIATVRHELFRIARSLEEMGITALLTAERSTEYDGVSRFDVEEFVLSNVILLRNALHQERRRRTVEIVKFRGAPHRTGEWLFTIDPREGIVLIPLAFLTPRERASMVRVSTGNAQLDRMIGGGLFQDAIVLLTGSTGAGKTLASLRFAATAYEAGERCVIYSFDETRDQLKRNAWGWGLDLDVMEASGLLRLVCDYPEVASLEDHFLRLRRTIDEFAPHRLVLDALSALERIATPRALLDFVIALGGVLRQHEITTLLTSAPIDRVQTSVTPTIAVSIASLTDVTINLRYLEDRGEIGRSITVVQTRGSAHDPAIREVTIDGAGMHIGPRIAGANSARPGEESTQDRRADLSAERDDDAAEQGAQP